MVDGSIPIGRIGELYSKGYIEGYKGVNYGLRTDGLEWNRRETEIKYPPKCIHF